MANYYATPFVKTTEKREDYGQQVSLKIKFYTFLFIDYYWKYATVASPFVSSYVKTTKGREGYGGQASMGQREIPILWITAIYSLIRRGSSGSRAYL